MSASPRLIDPSDLRRQLVVNPRLTLIDVDTPLEFADVHIPRARNEPLETLRAGALISSGIVSCSEPLCLVGRTEERAKAAAERFSAAGHRNVVVVLGGTLAWTAADLPVARSADMVVAPKPDSDSLPDCSPSSARRSAGLYTRSCTASRPSGAPD